jgi:hypothetical protein
MSIYVQFTDEQQLAVCAVFGEPQQDTDVWPNQGAIAEDDPRYVAYIDARRLPSAGEQVSDVARAWRDAEIVRVTWLRDRHRDEVEMGAETTISAEQYVELLAYIKALRDWPATAEFPAEESRPVVPEWVDSQAP